MLVCLQLDKEHAATLGQEEGTKSCHSCKRPHLIRPCKTKGCSVSMCTR